MKIKELHIKGFKSIDNHKGQTIPLGDVTVLLGANGSGKSNVVSFFEMLNFIANEKFSEYVGRYGTESILYYGSKHTEHIGFKVDIADDNVDSWYEFGLQYGASERIFFSYEKIKYFEINTKKNVFPFLPSGASETELMNFKRKNINSEEEAIQLSLIAIDYVLGVFKKTSIYQFHDTTNTAKIKYRCYIDDAKNLRHDAGNLAAFLKMLKESDAYNKYYKRIVRHIQQVMPQFGDFSLETLPNNAEYTRLNWYEKNNSEYLFGPHQISDGSLRFMALATLFLQPPDLMPSFIVIDEPELGLHPAAIVELAAMIRSASAKTQVLIATQSTLLVDEFSLENVVIVERDKENNCSVFKKYTEDELKEWLANYSLSELWEKNVLGGKP